MILTAFMKALATASVVAEDASTCKTTHSAIKILAFDYVVTRR